MSSSPDLPRVLPRVLIVSRRTVRKNKFVDFVGEYHLDLIVGYGAAPVIVPRVAGVDALLESFEPIHGVLLCEGEDIDPSLYSDSDASDDSSALSPEQLEKVLNVASGGTLFQDVEHELNTSSKISHINYDDYDGYRHPVRVVPGTPLHDWFADSLDASAEMMVNSYHHQGVRRLARRFVPMAFAPDGLVEGFYDPDAYSPGEGKFAVGLQFHPERMRKPDSDELEYPGCAGVYRDFVRAVVAYQDKLISATQVPRGMSTKGVNKEMLQKKQRKVILRSFSLAKDMHASGGRARPAEQQRDLDAGAELLESNTALSVQQEKRLKQMGATVRNASGYINSLNSKKLNDGRREAAARALMAEMTVDQLSSLASFYHTMGNICAEVLDRKLQSLHVQV